MAHASVMRSEVERSEGVQAFFSAAANPAGGAAEGAQTSLREGARLT